MSSSHGTTTVASGPAAQNYSQGDSNVARVRSRGGASSSAGAGAASDSDADDLLAALGYKPELKRTRSTLYVAFMSFVLASVPYGLATTLYYPLQNGGPVVVVWGWVLVSLIVLCVAASLGEITSVFPTAGGVYYQTFMLAPSSWRRLAAYICGWAYVVGNITITLAVQFGTTLFFVACVNVYETEPGVGIWDASTYQIFLTFVAVTVLCNLISIFGNRYLHILDVSPSHSLSTYLFHAFLPANMTTTDVCCRLDIYRSHLHHGDRPRRCQGWPPQWGVRPWSL